MKRRPRIQIKPNIGPKITSISSDNGDKIDNVVDDNEPDNTTENLNIEKNKSSTSINSETSIASNIDDLKKTQAPSKSKTESFQKPNTVLKDKNESFELEESLMLQESTTFSHDNKGKRRARITIKPNLFSKSFTQLVKPIQNTNEDKLIASSLNTLQNKSSLLPSSYQFSLNNSPKVNSSLTCVTNNPLNQKPLSPIKDPNNSLNVPSSIITHKHTEDEIDVNEASFNIKNVYTKSDLTEDDGSTDNMGVININEIVALETPSATMDNNNKNNINNNNINENNTPSNNNNNNNDINILINTNKDGMQDATKTSSSTTPSNSPIKEIHVVDTVKSDTSIENKKGCVANLNSLVDCMDDNESLVSVRKSLSSQQLDERLVSKKIKERQKSRLTQPLHGLVDTSVVCMKDLIYKNPVNNPMKYRLVETKKKRKTTIGEDDDQNVSDTCSVLSNATNNTINTIKSNKSVKGSCNKDAPKDKNRKNDEGREAKGGGDEDIAVPQIEVGADGKIIINEQSLDVMEESDGEMEVVNETDVQTSGYPKKNRARTWGINETKKFYAALSMIGTDFSLMKQVFTHRSRQEIKRKFKREDKLNRFLVDAALKERRALDITLLAEPVVEDLPKSKSKKKKIIDLENKKLNKYNEDKKLVNGMEDSLEDEMDEGVRIEKVVPGRIEKRKKMLLNIKNGRPRKKFTIYEDSGSEKEVEVKDEGVNKYEEADISEVGSVMTVSDEDEFSNDVEIVSIVSKRRTKSGRISKPPLTFQQMTSAIAASTFKAPERQDDTRLSQQLQQMQQDRRQKAILGVLNTLDAASVDDNESVMESNFDTASLADSVTDNNVVDCEDDDWMEKLKDLHSNLNVVDHNSINLRELGIEEIPPLHRLVIVSQKPREEPHEGSPAGEVEMHVFVVSDATLASVVRTASQSTRDPVDILFSLIHDQSTSQNNESTNVNTEIDSVNDANKNIELTDAKTNVDNQPMSIVH